PRAHVAAAAAGAPHQTAIPRASGRLEALLALGLGRAPGVSCRKASACEWHPRKDKQIPRETPVMQRAGISVAKLALRIGLSGLGAAAGAATLHAQQASDPPPPWKQGMPAAIADSKLAPIAPPPLPTAPDKLPIDKLKVKNGLKIEVYQAGVPNARTLRLGGKGTNFVSSPVPGKIQALRHQG